MNGAELTLLILKKLKIFKLKKLRTARKKYILEIIIDLIFEISSFINKLISYNKIKYLN